MSNLRSHTRSPLATDSSNSYVVVCIRHRSPVSSWSSRSFKESGTSSKSACRKSSTLSRAASLFQRTTLVRVSKTSLLSLLSSLHHFRSRRNSHASSSAWIKQWPCVICTGKIISFQAPGGGCLPTTRLRFCIGLLCRAQRADGRSSCIFLGRFHRVNR